MRRVTRAGLLEIWRYYQVGILNTLFGVGLYALLVRLGLNMYVAQAVAHVIGVAFNYFTYSRHVFRDSSPAKGRFIISYAASYLLSLATLAAVAQVIHSPYLAGIVATLIVSVINYFGLKHLVFKPRAS